MNGALDIWRTRIAGWSIAVAGSLAAATSAQDSLTVRGADGSLSERRGAVIDITGERVLLKVGPREQSIPLSQVVELRTAQDGLAADGDRLYSERNYETALAAYGRALEGSAPAWMRRRLLAGRVRAAVQMKAWPSAISDFLTLVDSDPSTQYFGEIPLVWTAAEPDAALVRQLSGWLASENPLLQLIAASHSLADVNREAALRVLERLSSHEDARIAGLAAAQRWRAVPRVDAATATQWTAQVVALPEPLRAGPHFALANAWSSVDPEQAILHWLRLPVLYGQRFDLASRGLLQAGEKLTQQGRTAEARIVLLEVVQRHGSTPEADLAEEKLRELSQANE